MESAKLSKVIPHPGPVRNPSPMFLWVTPHPGPCEKTLRHTKFTYPSSRMSLSSLFWRECSHQEAGMQYAFNQTTLHVRVFAFSQKTQVSPILQYLGVAIISLTIELIYQFEDKLWLTQPNSVLCYFLLAPELLKLVLFFFTHGALCDTCSNDPQTWMHPLT